MTAPEAAAADTGPALRSPAAAAMGPAPLSVARRFAALLVPWTFVLVFGALYTWLLLPRLLEGHLLGVCVGVFVAFSLGVFVVAAITFSRDILTSRWP